VNTAIGVDALYFEPEGYYNRPPVVLRSISHKPATTTSPSVLTAMVGNTARKQL